MERLASLVKHLNHSSLNLSLSSSPVSSWEDGYGVTNDDMKKLSNEQLSFQQNATIPSLSLDQWLNAKGKEVGRSKLFEITQERVDAFAVSTGDPQWIHEKSAAEKGSPFGAPIVHGYLLLSLTSALASGSLPAIEGTMMGLNYGTTNFPLLI